MLFCGCCRAILVSVFPSLSIALVWVVVVVVAAVVAVDVAVVAVVVVMLIYIVGRWHERWHRTWSRLEPIHLQPLTPSLHHWHRHSHPSVYCRPVVSVGRRYRSLSKASATTSVSSQETTPHRDPTEPWDRSLPPSSPVHRYSLPIRLRSSLDC